MKGKFREKKNKSQILIAFAFCGYTKIKQMQAGRRGSCFEGQRDQRGFPAESFSSVKVMIP